LSCRPPERTVGNDKEKKGKKEEIMKNRLRIFRRIGGRFCSTVSKKFFPAA
jgi:hypothetical protein